MNIITHVFSNVDTDTDTRVVVIEVRFQERTLDSDCV